MTAIPGPLDILTDVEALQRKIDLAIAAATVIANDTTLDAAVQADHAQRIVRYQAYSDYNQGFYSIP